MLDQPAPARLRRGRERRPRRGDRHRRPERSCRSLSTARARRAIGTSPVGARAHAATATGSSSPSPAPTSSSVFRTARRLARRPDPDRRVPGRRPRHPGRPARSSGSSAKGLGTGPNPNGPEPVRDHRRERPTASSTCRCITLGQAGCCASRRDKQIAAHDAGRRRTAPSDERAGRRRPARRCGPSGPIKHVFYIVKENRTYDQVLGDDPRGDGDPSLTLFGDHVHAERARARRSASRCSTTSTPTPRRRSTATSGRAPAKVSDYVHKSWFQNYGGRGRPYDFGVYAVTFPQNGFLFDQAERQGISYFNYGEAIAGRRAGSPTRTARPTSPPTRRASSPSPTSARTAATRTTRRSARTRSRGAGGVRLEPAGRRAARLAVALRLLQAALHQAQLATGTVPAFNYLVLTNDHTRGLERRRAHAAGDDRRQRPGARADRRPDLALVDLDLVGDLRRRGRLAGRRRPRRRAPHAGRRDLARTRSAARSSATATTSSR